jgi:hypothetical protein
LTDGFIYELANKFRLRLGMKDMTEGELIRINRDLSMKLRRVVGDYDFTVRELVQWILNDVDLEAYAKKFARAVESEVKAEKEAEREVEREAAEEETSTEEERAEAADDEAENFGTY